MWSDGRGRYYEVFPSGEQVFGVRTSDVSGRVVRSTKHLIRREARTGKFLWQGGRRTFELETHRAPEQLAWRCRSGGRDFYLEANQSTERGELALSSEAATE